MIRLSGRVLALVAMMAMPSAAFAQKEPADTKETKEAQKSMGLAMLQQTPDKKRPLLEAAMKQLQTAMTKNPENGKVWMMAGQVYVGLGEFDSAHAAFTKAESIFPGYAEDIAGEREVAWVEAFNAGITAMDQKNNDEAIAKLELAERLYKHRPEAKMNLGALYAQRGSSYSAVADSLKRIPGKEKEAQAKDSLAVEETQKAIDVFERAIEAPNGPLKEKLKPEEAANWKRYGLMAKSNIAQIVGSRGVELYQAEKYEEAAAAFARAAEINPYSRDYLYNIAQSHYARAVKLTEARSAVLAQRDTLSKAKPPKTAEVAAKTAEANRLGVELLPIFDQIAKMFERVLSIDPANTTLYALIAHAYKLSADVTMSDTARSNAFRIKALDYATRADTMAFEVTDLAATSSEAEARISGNVKNLKAAPGSPIKLKVTLLALDGTTVGTQEFTVAAPAANATAPIEGKTTVTGDVAGWKYEVVK